MTHPRNAEHQRAYRARKAGESLALVRIYAHPDDHEAIKRYAARLAKRRGAAR